MSDEEQDIPPQWRRASISPSPKNSHGQAELDFEDHGAPPLNRQGSSTSSIPREWRRASGVNIEPMENTGSIMVNTSVHPGGLAGTTSPPSGGSIPEMWKRASEVPPDDRGSEISPVRDMNRLRRESVKISKKMGGETNIYSS